MDSIISKMISDSLKCSISIVTFVGTVMTILGISFNNIIDGKISIICRLLILGGVGVVIAFLTLFIKYLFTKKCIKLVVGKNNVSITMGDIFKAKGARVIGFNTTYISDPDKIDGKIILPNSLQGKLVLRNKNNTIIRDSVTEFAKEKDLTQNKDGEYSFELGTVIPVNIDNNKYMLLALTELNDLHEAHTDNVRLMCTLMKMWKNLYTYYGKDDIVLPILGNGITRMDSGNDEPSELLRCMIQSLAYTGIHFKSKIHILVYDKKDYRPFQLYNLKYSI